MPTPVKQVALIILDGWGHSALTENNAIASAHTPYFDYLIKKFPNNLLHASGNHVGLPDGQVGNSEIGHTTIGAGTVIDTDLVRIDKSIKSGQFLQNETFKKLFSKIISQRSNLHLIVLLSEGGVHSHQDHLFAFLENAQNILLNHIKEGSLAVMNLPKIFIHAITDGRDTDTKASLHSIKKLENIMVKTSVEGVPLAKIASVSGRYFAMDRDNNWDRLDRFMQVLLNPSSHVVTTGAIEMIMKSHDQGISDEHIEPFSLVDLPLANNDAILILNFRSDRVRMLTSKLLEKKKDMNLQIATMTEYSKDFDVDVAFGPISIVTTLAKEISLAKMTQAHIAETEKFPHATYFLNGGQENPHQGEEHVLLESRKDVKTHNLAPEMRAEAIADEAIKRIKAGVQFIFINFANPDMVGHTADVPAIIKAVETVDRELKKVVDELLAHDGVAIITADHGNAELNRDPTTDSLHTSHTLNLVPCIITIDKGRLKKEGSLKDLAPTALDLLGITKPKEMTGESMIIK